MGGILLAAVAAVAEVPVEGERTATLLLDRRGELHLQGRRALVGLGLRDDVELVLLFALPSRGRTRHGGGVRSDGGRGCGRGRLLPSAAACGQAEQAHDEPGTQQGRSHQSPPLPDAQAAGKPGIAT